MKNLAELLALANKPKNWLVKDFILKGDQVLIAAAPKAGKTLLASQLALAVASGKSFLNWQVDHPAKVLYFNLEVHAEMFGERVAKQVLGLDALPNTNNVMVDSTIKGFDIMNPQSRTEIAHIIKQSGAELVFFDVLARCHSASENSNSEMKDVLKELRFVCGEAASVVIHHSRKPPQGQEEENLGAYALRGASAIHGEVDLVLSLAKRSGNGARFSLKFSARNIREPDEMFLEMDEATLRFFQTEEKETDHLLTVLNEAFSMSPEAPVKQIQQHVSNAYGVEKRQAQRLLETAVASKWISEPTRRGNQYWYVILDRRMIACFDKAA
jgi:RecA-family ATPase